MEEKRGIRSECDEAGMRVALNDAAPLYRDAPEARKATTSAGDLIVQTFSREALPKACKATREIAGNLIPVTLSQVGRHFSQAPRTTAEVKAFADAIADMFLRLPQRLRREQPGMREICP